MKTVALADLLTESRAGFWGGEAGTGEADVRVVRNGDIQQSGVRWRDLPLRSVLQRELERAEVREGDILITTSGNCGYVAHVEARPVEPCIASNFVRILRFDEARVEPRYAFHFLSTDGFRARLAPFIRGTTMKNLSLAAAAEAVQMPLWSLQEQRRIAAILDQADALRDKRRSGLAQLDSLVQSIFLEMFGDPVLNSMGWRRMKLAALGSLDRGVSRHRPRNAPELLGGPYPFVQTGDVANSGGYVRHYSATYSEAGLRQSKMWPAGTLCITIAANIARTGILTFDACFPDSVVGFRSDTPGMTEYVRCWLSFLQRRLEQAAPESAQKNINLETLRSLDVPVPTEDLVQDFARRVEAAEALRGGWKDSLSSLDALSASLERRAFLR